MSTSIEANLATGEPSPPRIDPPLSDEARAKFVSLIHKYCVDLPKSQDSDNFHLETARLCMAIGVGL
jgi:hypothetical protein